MGIFRLFALVFACEYSCDRNVYIVFKCNVIINVECETPSHRIALYIECCCCGLHTVRMDQVLSFSVLLSSLISPSAPSTIITHHKFTNNISMYEQNVLFRSPIVFMLRRQIMRPLTILIVKLCTRLITTIHKQRWLPTYNTVKWSWCKAFAARLNRLNVSQRALSTEYIRMNSDSSYSYARKKSKRFVFCLVEDISASRNCQNEQIFDIFFGINSIPIRKVSNPKPFNGARSERVIFFLNFK